MADKKKPPKRDYKKENENFGSKPIEKKHRAARNKARNEAIKAGKVKKGDGKEIDHIVPLSKGGSNSKKNQRVVARKTNRKKGVKVIQPQKNKPQKRKKK